MMGRILASRSAASSGSEGGLTGLASGSRRWCAALPLFLRDLPIFVGGDDVVGRNAGIQ